LSTTPMDSLIFGFLSSKTRFCSFFERCEADWRRSQPTEIGPCMNALPMIGSAII
jgi:hypothetical protein